MLPDFQDYSEEAPADFFLAGDDKLLSMADSAFEVEGQLLPVHKVLLKQRCRAFAGLSGKGAAAAVGGGGIPMVARLPEGRTLDIIMTDTLPAGHPRSLEGYTLKRVAHFLRFLYHPVEVEALDVHLPGAAKSLSACARLAAALDVPELLEALEGRMEETVDMHTPALHRLMDWAGVAEECGLTRLWTKCVREMAVLLARGRWGLHPRVTSDSNLLATGPERPPVSPPSPAGKLAGGGAALPALGTDVAQTAVHDVALLRPACVPLPAPARRHTRHLQDLTPRTQLAVMATLLASLRKIPGDAAALVPPEDSLEAALPALQPIGTPPGELAA